MSEFDKDKLNKRINSKRLNYGSVAQNKTKKNRLWLLSLLVVGVAVTLYCMWKRPWIGLLDNHVVIVDDTMKRQTDVDVVKDSLVILDSITTNPTKEEAEEAKAVDVRPKGEFVPAERTKDVDVHLMAKRVIRGDFGNGDDRKKALDDEYQIIQHQVNLNYRNGDLNW